MPNYMLLPEEAVPLHNKYACYHESITTQQCKLRGKGCPFALDERKSECGCYIHPDMAVRKRSLPKQFRELIEDSVEGMVFVEHGDPRFTDEDLVFMLDFMLLRHKHLLDYIHIERNPDSDTPMITIFEGFHRLFVD